MIDENVLNKICPVPDEEEVMEEIKEELTNEGFVITNFNKGGIFYVIIRIFVKIYVELKSVAQNIINSMFIKHAEDDWLIIKAADFGKSLKEAVKTRGYITIYREDYSSALQITKGHPFKTLPDETGTELKYYVLDHTVIPAGEAVGKVLVEAEGAGIRYNVVKDKITVSMIYLDGVSYVTNEDDWIVQEGSDEESLESLRERTEGAWSELSERTTEEKLINVAKKVAGVLNVRIDAQHPRGQGTTDIIVTGVNGEATHELLERVKEATEYLMENYDDWGYKSSEVVKIALNVRVFMAKDVSTDGIAEKVENLLTDYMQLSNRKELNCLYTDDLRYIIKDSIEECRRIEITEPASDMILSEDKVIMMEGITITVQNMGGV